MPSFNQVILMGNVTRDPQAKTLPNGDVTLVEFGLATNRKYKTAGGEEREETCFIDCTAFGRQAEVIQQYCTKGKPLFIHGRLKYDSWEDKQGGKRSKITVVVENFQFVGGKDGNGSFPGAAAADSNGQRNTPDAPPTAAFRGGGRRAAKSEDPFDGPPKFQQSDIPF